MKLKKGKKPPSPKPVVAADAATATALAPALNAQAAVEAPDLIGRDEPRVGDPLYTDQDDAINLDDMPGGLADDNEVAAAQAEVGITPKKDRRRTPSGNKVARKQRDHAHRGNLVLTKVGNNEILGLVVNDEGDTCIVCPVNENAELPPMKLAKTAVVKAAYTSAKLAMAALSIPESTLGKDVWHDLHSKMDATADAKAKTDAMGGVLFGQNWAIQFKPKKVQTVENAAVPHKS